MKKIKCPSCGADKRKMTFAEEWKGAVIRFEFTASGVLIPVGHEIVGDPYRVSALCECGRSWYLRGVTQITELGETADL